MTRANAALAAALLVAVTCAPAAGQATITLAADNLPVGRVLEVIARQAGLTLEVAGRLPETTITIELRGTTVEAALHQVCGRIGFQFTLTEGKLKVEPAAEPAAAPAIAGVPQPVAAELRRRVEALAAGRNGDRGWHDFGQWLAELRPDWRATASATLPALWPAGQPPTAGALRGARACWRLGQLEAVRALVPTGGDDPAERAAGRCLLARCELAAGNPGRALDEARRALKSDPECGEAAALAAEAQLYLGRAEEALAEALAAEARWPRDAAVLAVAGNLLRRQDGSAGEAARMLQKALGLEPDNADARYGLALLAQGALEVRRQWLSFLAVEPFSIRALRVGLGIAAVDAVRLTERGGPAWALSADGERVVYTMRSRKELEITDVAGSGLAAQVTDQPQDKVGASISPDDQRLAWIVPSPMGDELYLQSVNNSGGHVRLYQAPRGAGLRRTGWTPDGLLLVSEVLGGPEGRAVRLHAWDPAAGAEVPLPAALALDGLGDVSWRPGGAIVGTVTRAGVEAVVAIAPDGRTCLLRPPDAPGSYGYPDAAPDLCRVSYQGGQLYVAPADGALAPGVRMLATARSSAPGIWSADGGHMVVTLDDLYPASVRLTGLPPRYRLLLRPEPLLLDGPRPPKLRFDLRNLGTTRLKGALEAAVVADDGTASWSGRQPVDAPPGREVPVTLQPGAGQPGVNWLKVTIVLGDVADPARWYRYRLTGNGQKR